MGKIQTIVFWILSCTWGIIMTLIGAIGAAFFSIKGRKPHFYKGAIYFEVGGPE